MCCGDPPPPPDLSGMSGASIEVAKLQQKSAEDQLAWAKQQDTMNRATLERVLGVQLPAMEDQANWAKEDRARYKELYQPLEDQFVQDAQTYDSAERRGEAMGQSVSQVNQQFDAQRRNALQRLESYGVDPSQTRNAALDVGVRMQQAQAQAQAATGASNRVEDVGRAMRADSINMGRGMAAQAAQGYAGANNSGNSAVGNSNQTTGTSMNALTSHNAGMNSALGGYGQGANIMQMDYGNQMNNWNIKQDQRAGTLQAVGSVFGMFKDGGHIPAAIPSPVPGQNGTVDPKGMIPHIGRGDGSGIDDTVPAMVSEGEYVIPADVVKAKGMEFFDKLLERYHTPADEQRSAQ